MNYLAIGLAALAAFVLGWLWYGPLFGKRWMVLSGITQRNMQKAQREGMGRRLGLSFLGNAVLAAVLAYFIRLIGAPGITGGIEVAFWAWLGFVATNTLSSVLWESKPWGLYVLNNAYNLVMLAAMGAIIGAF